MIQDRQLKDMLYKHFKARGWLVQMEVPILATNGIANIPPPITDIDVLGIQPSIDLKWNYIIGDCKTRKKESPINRVLWVQGLKEVFGASSGVVLLQKEKNNKIEFDHKMVADEHNILLLLEDEFDTYDKAIIYPTGSRQLVGDFSSIESLNNIGSKFPPLKQLSRWVFADSWQITDHAVLLRQSISNLMQQKGELDPRRNDHLALIVEGALVFSVAFATLVGKIFRRHLQPSQRDDLDEAVRVFIWGGRDQYKFYEQLRQQFSNSEFSKSSNLSLPEWGRFLELTRSLLEAPRYAFRIPQFLRRLSVGIESNKIAACLANEREINIIHFSMKILDYVCRAADLPKDATLTLQNILVPRMSELSHKKEDMSTNANIRLSSINSDTNDIAVPVIDDIHETGNENEGLDINSENNGATKKMNLNQNEVSETTEPCDLECNIKKSIQETPIA